MKRMRYYISGKLFFVAELCVIAHVCLVRPWGGLFFNYYISIFVQFDLMPSYHMTSNCNCILQMPINKMSPVLYALPFHSFHWNIAWMEDKELKIAQTSLDHLFNALNSHSAPWTVYIKWSAAEKIFENFYNIVYTLFYSLIACKKYKLHIAQIIKCWEFQKENMPLSQRVFDSCGSSTESGKRTFAGIHIIWPNA